LINPGDLVATGRFRVLRRVGQGGMGVVYEATDLSRQTRVALKTLSHLEPERLYRLKNEFRSLQGIAHPHLVGFGELVEDDGQWFVSMEFVEGVDFLAHVRPGLRTLQPESLSTSPAVPAAVKALAGAQPPAALAGDDGEVTPPPTQDAAPAGPTFDAERLRTALLQLTDAVVALHQAGRLHRDLKPSNVLVTPSGRVVVVDFGLAGELGPTRSGWTRTGEIMGTPAYLAPELVSGSDWSPSCDWYAIGVMLYEALAGVPPFPGNGIGVLLAKCTRDPISPADLVPGLPADLVELAMGLLRRDPEQRLGGPSLLARLRGGDGAGAAASTPPSVTAQLATPAGLGSSPVVGRSSALKALLDAHGRALAGRPVLARVHGPSGIGKSTLLRQFLDHLRSDGNVTVLEGRCYQREAVPYKALDAVIDDLAQQLRRWPEPDAAAVLPREAQALAQLFPVLGAVLALARLRAKAVVPGAQGDDPQERRRRGASALRELLARITDRRPLAVVIDDLQWGDTDSAALLAELFRGAEPVPLLLVAAYRSDEVESSACLQLLLPAARGALGDDVEVRLAPLAAEDAHQLARALLASRTRGPAAGGPPGNAADLTDTEALAQELVREAQGSPFFLTQLARYFVEESGASQPGTLRELKSSQRISLAEVLRARLARLPDAARLLLEVVCVAGRPIAAEVAAVASGLDPGPPGLFFQLAEGLGQGRLIRVRSDGPGGTVAVLEPYHDRIRELVTVQLARESLIASHRALASALEARGAAEADHEALAEHFHGAGDTAKGGHYAALAADRAARALAFDRAARLYRLALQAEGLSAEVRRELQVQLGESLSAAGRGAEAAQVFLEPAAGLSTMEGLELRRRAAVQMLRSGRVDEGLETLRSALAPLGIRLARSPLRALLALLWRRLQLALRGLSFKERDPAQVDGRTLSLIDTCWSVSTCLGVIDPIPSADFSTRHLLLALRAGEPFRLARGLAAEAAFAAGMGNERRAAELLATADELAGRSGQVGARAVVALSAGVSAFLLGQWKTVCEQMGRAQTRFREAGVAAGWELTSVRLFTVWSRFYLGQLAELGRLVPELFAEARERGDVYLETGLKSGHAHVAVLLAQDDVAGAEKEAGEALRFGSGFRNPHFWGLLGLAMAELYSGRGPAAWQRITTAWPTLRKALLLQITNTRIEAVHLRARCALAAADATTPPAELLRSAEKDARMLERAGLARASGWGGLIRGGLAARRGALDEAARSFRAAEQHFEGADMALYAAAARRRHGLAIGGDEGKTLVESAETFMRSQGVRRPGAMTAMLAPGGLKES
jgi:serine/threonine protein kinase